LGGRKEQFIMVTTTMDGPAGKIGRIIGGWIGRALGALIPPPGLGSTIGGMIGSELGEIGGKAAAGWLSQQMTGANEDAVPQEEATDDTETCQNCRTQQCKDLEADINRRLYNSKRRPGADGYHGQFPRRAEQICGASGPGSEGWNIHDRILRQQSGELRRLHDAYKAAACKGHPEENINWEDMEWAQSDTFSPAPSEWLGPNNAQCQTAKELIRLNQGREAARLVDSFPRPTGPAIY
jgi:hypothetical protein